MALRSSFLNPLDVGVKVEWLLLLVVAVVDVTATVVGVIGDFVVVVVVVIVDKADAEWWRRLLLPKAPLHLTLAGTVEIELTQQFDFGGNGGGVIFDECRGGGGGGWSAWFGLSMDK